MGVIMKNGINYSSDNAVSLTQAEYNALVAKDPNTTYYITDVYNGHSKADASDVAYGDGTVKDALDVKVMSSSTSLDSVITTGTYIVSGSSPNVPESATGVLKVVRRDGTDNVFQTWEAFQRGSLRYIRRLVNGTWTSWLPTHDSIYSSDEVRVGTWIDGKPLYRKVISYRGSIIDKVSIPHGVSNMKIGFIRMGTVFNGTSFFLLPTWINTTSFVTAILYGSGNIDIHVGSNWNFGAAEIVIEYTKTTD